MLATGFGVRRKWTAVAILDTDSGAVQERKVPTREVPEFLQELSVEVR